MKYFSMFSGIGGFELGIEKAGNQVCGRVRKATKRNKRSRTSLKGLQECNESSQHRGNSTSIDGGQEKFHCIGFSEIDKYAIQIYKKHFPSHKNYGNARRIIPKKLPDFDLLVGGFPCQSFSIAGKRGGFEDTRGTLFFEIARIVKSKRPKLLLLENVKGLLSHDSGRTFGTILATLSELGYVCEWQILNSKDFGVPQNRERVFIIGHLGGIGGQAIFPIGEGDGEVGAEIKRIGSNDVFRRYNQTYDISGSVESIDTSQGGGHQPCIIVHSLQTRSADRPSLTRKCDCGSGKLYQKCCGTGGG